MPTTSRGAALFVAALTLAGCTRTVVRTVRGGAPPPPSAGVSPGSNQPPVVWLSGTLAQVATDHVVLDEPGGSAVTVQRLGAGATVFFRLSDGTWEQLAPAAPVAAGQEACVEAVMAAPNLLALRVFLGAVCGPT